MKTPLLISMLLVTAAASAEPMYVSDELVLSVYADKDSQSNRIATVKAGSKLEQLTRDGDYAQVQLADGREGWVRASYLTSREPAGARIKKLEDELKHARACPRLRGSSNRWRWRRRKSLRCPPNRPRLPRHNLAA
jgi:SH3 domain protein